VVGGGIRVPIVDMFIVQGVLLGLIVHGGHWGGSGRHGDTSMEGPRTR
jgi:hypothetical protein